MVKTHQSKTTFRSFTCQAHHADELWLYQKKMRKKWCSPAYCLPCWQNTPQGRSWSTSSSGWEDFNPYYTSPWRVPNCYPVRYYATPSVSTITFYMYYVCSHWAKKREKVNLTLHCRWREELHLQILLLPLFSILVACSRQWVSGWEETFKEQCS